LASDAVNPAGARVVIVSPCRDEARTLERTIACMEAQTRPPARWIVVDDGSTDATPQLLEAARARIPWLRVVKRADRGFRKLGGGVIDAFYDGVASADVDYDFVAKMDVDLEFSSHYLEHILGYFARDPKLAAASGKVFRPEGDGFVEEFMIDDMVAGQFKLYRRDAFERIGGFVREIMWDGIDFHRARMAGYRTASLPDPELRIIHLRLMGSSDKNIYRGRLRWGRGQWFMGSSFPYVLASGVFRMREEPYIVGGLLIVAGYLGAAIRRAPRYQDPAFRKNLQRWQRRRLTGLLAGKGPR
jgi:poly-beta-1,6-N-acetyl-D-glucosamine synthase